jgi:hypothetical protein
MKIRLVGAELFHTDRQTNIKKLISRFSQFLRTRLKQRNSSDSFIKYVKQCVEISGLYGYCFTQLILEQFQVYNNYIISNTDSLLCAMAGYVTTVCVSLRYL